MRDGDRCQADGFHGAVRGDEGVELRVQLAGLRRGEPAAGFAAFDVGLDVGGEVEDEADAGASAVEGGGGRSGKGKGRGG